MGWFKHSRPAERRSSDEEKTFLNKLTDDLDAGGHQIKKTAAPTEPKDVVNEEYAKSTFAQLDGSAPMSGNLDMGEHLITRLGYPKNILEATNKSYVGSEIALCLKRDGTNPARGDLNMNDNAINNLKAVDADTSSASTVTRHYVDESIVEVSGGGENPFDFLITDISKTSAVRNIQNLRLENPFTKTPLGLNKSALSITITSTGGEYNATLRFKVTSLRDSFHTFVVEFYPREPNPSNVVVNTSLTTLNMREAGPPSMRPFYSTPNAAPYTKKLFKLEKTRAGEATILLRLSGNIALSNPPARVVVYGMYGLHSSVPSNVFDPVFKVKNGELDVGGNLNMENKKILNLQNAPTDPQDAANNKYVDDIASQKIGKAAQTNLNMNNNQIINLSPPTNNLDAVTKQYTNASFLKRDGSEAMFRDLSMGGRKITNTASPNASSDVVK